VQPVEAVVGVRDRNAVGVGGGHGGQVPCRVVGVVQCTFWRLLLRQPVRGVVGTRSSR
jgi:hypothetical protein